ncbi:MAG TPA: hypothetical protein PLV92_20040, partial [Pirellulaceae bacterium]|nr:hypothetical protein [Pirellulaceae bacterium]
MSNRKVRWFVGGILGLTIVAAMAAGTSELRADAKRNELDRLLDLGWKAKPDNTREVDGYYEELFASSSRDPQVTYAYALVKIKLRKYSEAADLIDEVLDQQPKNLIAWRAKLWLATILKNYSEALVVAQKYVDAFPAPPAGDAGEGIEAKPDASKTGKSSAKGATAKASKSKVGAGKGPMLGAALVADPALEHATFLGRILGYMEGPQADAIPKATYATVRKKIVERLTDDRRKAFEDGAKELVDEFLELSEAKEIGREQAKEQAEQDKEERLKTIDAQRERDKQRSSELTSTKDRIRADYETQVRDLQKQDEPLARQFAQLDSQGTFARNEQARLLL